MSVDYKQLRRVIANAQVALAEAARTQRMTSTMPWSQAAAIIRSAAEKEGVVLNARGIERVGVLAAKIAEGMAFNNEVDARAAFH